MKQKKYWYTFGVLFFVGVGVFTSASGKGKDQVLEKFYETEKVFSEFSTSKTVKDSIKSKNAITSKPIVAGKKRGDVLHASEFNRLLEVLLNTNVPIGQGCDNGYFIAGFDSDGGVLCQDSLGRSKGKGSDEYLRGVLKNDLTKKNIASDILPGAESESIVRGKASGELLTAPEFNRLVQVLEKNFSLLGRSCSTGKSLRSINKNGSFNCGAFSSRSTVIAPVNNKTKVQNWFKKGKKSSVIFLNKKKELVTTSNIGVEKSTGDKASSSEFNRIFELLIISENMIASSCPNGKLVTGFDDNGYIICNYTIPKNDPTKNPDGTKKPDPWVVPTKDLPSCESLPNVCKNVLKTYVKKVRDEPYSCSGDETCWKKVFYDEPVYKRECSSYGSVCKNILKNYTKKTRSEAYSCSSDETCYRDVIDKQPVYENVCKNVKICK